MNLSDREVNLKILLNEALRRGEATLDDRNQLLRRLKSTVAAQVLRDNESNSRAVSLDEYRARRGVDHFWALMGDLTRSGLLDRDAEGLPSWDVLAARRKAHRSLTRPELAVLLSYAKLHLKSALLASDLPDDPAAVAYFYDYFPADPVAAARTCYWVTEELRLPWLMRSIERAGAQGKWERHWALGLAHDLGAVRRRVTEAALTGQGGADGAGAPTDPTDGNTQTVAGTPTDQDTQAHQGTPTDLGFADPDGRLDRFHDLLEEMQSEETASQASLSAAVQEIRNLGNG